MRTLLAVSLLAAALGGCALGPPKDAKPFWWLTGSWATAPDEGNHHVEEYWAPPASNAMVGFNRSIEDDVMVAFEYLRIVETPDGGITYLASPGGRQPPTEFPLIDYSDEHAIFENPEHDFPQRIIYRRLDRNRLLARIEGKVDGEMRSMVWRYHQIGAN